MRESFTFSFSFFWFSDEFKNLNNEHQDYDESSTITPEMSKPTFQMDQSAMAKPLLSEMTFTHDEMGVDKPTLHAGRHSLFGGVSLCLDRSESFHESVGCMHEDLLRQ